MFAVAAVRRADAALDVRVAGDDLAGGAADVRVQRQQQPDADGRPTSWATTKPGTEAGAMPAKVSVNARPMVTAGLAKLVEDVNQYAAPM